MEVSLERWITFEEMKVEAKKFNKANVNPTIAPERNGLISILFLLILPDKPVDASETGCRPKNESHDHQPWACIEEII